MNTTHPDAKPREQRDLDDIVWFWTPFGARFGLITGNGETLATGLSKETAKHLCREHNRAIGV